MRAKVLSQRKWVHPKRLPTMINSVVARSTVDSLLGALKLVDGVESKAILLSIELSISEGPVGANQLSNSSRFSFLFNSSC